VGISSAGIFGDLFRHHGNFGGAANREKKSNEVIDPLPFGLTDCSGRQPDRIEARFIPKRYCKSFAIGSRNAGDAAEWHRLVTCVQQGLAGWGQSGGPV
jgi:hypothetical protein